MRGASCFSDEYFVSDEYLDEYLFQGIASTDTILCLINIVIKNAQSYSHSLLWDEYYNIKLMMMIKMYNVIFVLKGCR